MYIDIYAAAKRIEAAGLSINRKRLAAESGHTLWVINKQFRDGLELDLFCGDHARHVPFEEFEDRIRKAALSLAEEEFEVTIPNLADKLRDIMSDKAIRARLNSYPDLKTEIGLRPRRQ